MTINQIEQLIKDSSYWNWDDDRGEPITPETWATVKHLLFLAQSIHQDVSNVHISPCGDGSVHLVWFSPSSIRGIFEVASHRKYTLWSIIHIEDGKDTFEELKNVDECLEKLRWFFENYG